LRIFALAVADNSGLKIYKNGKIVLVVGGRRKNLTEYFATLLKHGNN
jgi:hypothetical protein